MARLKKAEKIDNTQIVEVSDRLKIDFLTYSLSIITRGVPLSNDGLKPVQRRILYAMLAYEKRLTKSARIVGDTLGKFHPHGDSSVYSAMVSLAQPFKRNYPLIEGQGNWGTIDGDGAASMRYTECKLSKFCMDVYFAEGWDKIDWNMNYDDSLSEPVAFAPVIPMLLVNGSVGIITGFATSIPPHNLKEVCDATLAYLRGEDNISSYIKGPDFPTGGVVEVAANTMQRFLNDGKGSVKVYARYTIKPYTHGRYLIEVSNIPYGTSKENMIDRFRKLYKDNETLHKNIPSDGILDLSDDEVCLNFICKKGVSEGKADELAQYMIKMDILSNTINYTCNVVEADGYGIVPKRASVQDMIDDWYKHRSNTLKVYFDYKIADLNKKIKLNQDLQIFIKNFKKLSLIILDHTYISAMNIFKSYGIDNEGFDYILSRSFKSMQNKGEEIVEDRLKLEKALKEFERNRKNIKKYIENEVVGIVDKYARARRTIIKTPTKKVSVAKAIGTITKEVKSKQRIAAVKKVIKEPIKRKPSIASKLKPKK